MHDYKKLYLKLFGAMSDALEAIERQTYGDAWNILAAAQEEAEEIWVEEEEIGGIAGIGA